MLAVLPAWQGQGIGTGLMQQILGWCEARGCPTMDLEAEEHAAPLYARLGFVIEEPTLSLAQTVQSTLHSSPNVTLVNADDLSALIQFDAAQFGGTRSAMLLAHWKSNRERTFVTRNTSGQITGYLLAQTGSLGPWVASTLHEAERLLTHALALSFVHQPTVTIPSSNTQGIALLQQSGFTQRSETRFMWHGKPFAGDRSVIYGQASPALG